MTRPSTAPKIRRSFVVHSSRTHRPPPCTGLNGLPKDRRELKKESTADAFLGALDYLTKLSSLNAEKANQVRGLGGAPGMTVRPRPRPLSECED